MGSAKIFDLGADGTGGYWPALPDVRRPLDSHCPQTQAPDGEGLRLPVRDDAEPFATLRRQCTRWGQDHVEAIRSADPPQPPGLNDRAADNWRPLCAIAEVAGGNWPGRITAAIAALTVTEGDNEEIGVLLLKDMEHIFTEQKVDAISSEDLAQQLHGMEERPWSEYGRERKPISKGQIARLLKPFEIRPRNVRIEETQAKGYRLDACQDAFQRYISPVDTPSLTVPPSQANNDAAKRENQPVPTPPVGTGRKSQNPAPILDFGTVGRFRTGG